MGTYNNSVQEIYDAVEKVLDDIEGDFNKETMRKALKKIAKEYKHCLPASDPLRSR